METSYKKLFEFEKVAIAYLNQNADETPLSFALEDALEKVRDIKATYSQKVVKIQRAHASVDKYGDIRKDERGNYLFTPEKEEKMESKVSDLFEDEEAVEIEVEYVDVIPKDLNRNWIKHFKGFVIDPGYVKPIIEAE